MDRRPLQQILATEPELKMTITWRLILMTAISLLFTVLVGGSGIWAERTVSGALQENAMVSAALRNHMQADMMHDALRGDVLLAMSNGSKKKMDQRKDVEQALAGHMSSFTEALKNNEALPLPAEITASIAKVRPLVDTYLKESQLAVAVAFDQPAAMDIEFDKFMNTFEALEQEMASLSALIEKNTAETTAASQATAARSERIILITWLVSSMFLGLFALVTIRTIAANIRRVLLAVNDLNSGDSNLNQRIPDMQGEFAMLGDSLNAFIANLARIIGEISASSGAISTGSRQISMGSRDLSQRTESQASALEETASSMEQLTATVKQNADNVREASNLAVSASAVASKGGLVVSQVVETMDSINTSAKKIVDIISVIDGIAFQTNILALNAAVEAARAGEQGRGFAVVASEVRNLAQRSASAAREIKSLIGDSVDKVDAGARLVEQAGATMDEVVASVARVTGIISEIAAASIEQTLGINHISQAITHMDQSTQQNAALVEQSTAAAESMQEQADNLVNAISVFQVDGIQATLQPFAPAILATPLRQHRHTPKVVPMRRKAALASQPSRQVLQAPE